MLRLSHTLGELYGIIQDVPVGDCINELFLATRKLIAFDGAAMGDASGPEPYGLIPSAAHTCCLSRELVDTYARIGPADPIASVFHASGMKTLSVDCERAYAAGQAHALRELAESHHIGHLLLTGSPTEWRTARWIILARSSDAPFREIECTYLEAAWPHLARCLQSLRRRVLAELADTYGPGVALLYPDGAVAEADARFQALCHNEWHNDTDTLLPPQASAALIDECELLGRTLRLRLWQENGFTVCHAAARSACDLLTRAERVVAEHYANGESHKEIAVVLSVSENTVRTHLAHVYDKLGVHRKAELMRELGHLH